MQPQYITNAEGDKVSVILPLADYQKLLETLEDLEDLALVREREHETGSSLEDVVARLKANGKI